MEGRAAGLLTRFESSRPTLRLARRRRTKEEAMKIINTDHPAYVATTPVLEALRAGIVATAPELVTLIQAEVPEREPQYLVTSISNCWRSAVGGWEHVHRTLGPTRTRNGNPMFVYRWAPDEGARAPEPQSNERMRKERAVALTTSFLRSHRGRVFLIHELVEAIGYPGSDAGLRHSLSHQKDALQKGGVRMVSVIKDRRLVYGWYASAKDGSLTLPDGARLSEDSRLPAAGAPPKPKVVAVPEATSVVNGSPFVAVGSAVYDPASDQLTFTPTEPEREVVEAWMDGVDVGMSIGAEAAAPKGVGVVTSITKAEDPEWTTITVESERQGIGRRDVAALLKRSDGTLWKATPFSL